LTYQTLAGSLNFPEKKRPQSGLRVASEWPQSGLRDASERLRELPHNTHLQLQIKHLRWMGAAPSHPGWVCCRQPLLCCSSIASTLQYCPSPACPPTPDQARGHSTSDSAWRSPATSQDAWMWYQGVPQPGWMLTGGVVSSAHAPPAPLTPPDQRIRPQTGTGAVISRPEQLAMVLQCP
jgi:hypothetical protein